MQLSVSDLKLFMVCPRMFWYQKVKQRVPAAPEPTPLAVGTAVHAVLAAKLLGFGLSVIDMEPEAQEKFDELAPVLEAWQKPATWEVVATELEVRYGPLVGRVDFVVRAMGGLWIGQHKTVAGSVNTATYAEAMRTDWHESFYHLAVENHYGEPVRGTVLNLIKKFSKKMLAERGPEAAIEIHYLPRSRMELEEAWLDMNELIKQINDSEQQFIMNRAACAGPFRNSLCKYKHVCDSGNMEKLNGGEFKDAEARYDESGGSGEAT